MSLFGMPLSGAIEAGGTKFICGVGTGPEDIRTVEIPTTTPEATVGAAIAWLRAQGRNGLRAVGIGSFGPVNLDITSPAWGSITSTPKAGWRNYPLAETVRQTLQVPVAFDTDVNAAVLGEARWGAARGISNAVYITVGTGIGAGAICGGRILHGASHPEMGHMLIPHDTAADPYPGCCPFHGDCLEGLASGPSIEGRWGAPASTLPPGHPAWPLEARYLATGLANLACLLAPELIILGGGVMRQAFLYPMIDAELRRSLAGYVATPRIVCPGLGGLSGVLGALALAQNPDCEGQASS